jgi:2-amino-4-hydroxy-6-hydroxymethyldihydropteridine diphosphokinase
MRPLLQNTRVGGGSAMVSRALGAVVAPASCWRVGGPQFLSPAPLLKSRKAVFVADPMKKTVYLSLGSNLGDRAKNLRDAIAALGNAGVSVVRFSSVYETEPVDYLDQPWFLNCVVEAETELAALDLLRALRGIETEMGSKKLIAKGPRLIDIDILLYGNEIIDTPELQVPHRSMHLRRFVLQPLAEIAPAAQHPVSHLSVSELLTRTPDKSAVRVAPGP